MKRIIAILAIATTCALTFAQTARTPAGKGTPSNPYQIATLDNLYWLSQHSEAWKKGTTFVQTADIDASATKKWDFGKGFTPIAKDRDNTFDGNYDGQAHTISNLYINRKEWAIGFFGFANGASIKNLGVTNATILSQSKPDKVYNSGVAGGLIGAGTYVEVFNCYATGSVTCPSGWAGGLIGYMFKTTISQCHSACSVQGDAGGGLVGCLGASAGDIEHGYNTITDCFSTGNVQGPSGHYVGGLVGYCTKDTTITNCYWNIASSGQSNGIGKDMGTHTVIGLGTNPKIKNGIPVNPDAIAYAIKDYVTAQVTQWQQKGEFEKTVDYQLRVTEANRNQKISEYTAEILAKMKAEYAKTLHMNTSRLDSYDADNEAFLVHSDEVGDFTVPVPPAEAPSFKQNWAKVSYGNFDFSIRDGEFRLARVTLTNPAIKKGYVYDSKTPTVYATNEIQFNFAPIEVAVADSGPATSNLQRTSTTTTVGLSDVDVNIPRAAKAKDSTFAVIIANENYLKEIKVRYAQNDGKAFKDYCEQALGIPATNVHFVSDATFGGMRSEIKWLSGVLSAYQGQARAIFYYAGHGMPNERDKTAYLLPVDGFSSDCETAIKLDELYATLSGIPSQGVTFILDACFSGSTRENKMLAEARGIAVVPRDGPLQSKTIVLSAASGDETAYPYADKQHGLFTYFLLKKLQETGGNVTYEDLSKYIISNVSRQSIVVNQKSQTPQIKTSPDLTDKWKTMPFD